MIDDSGKPSPFQKATAIEQVEPGLFAARIPEGWAQGRGAHGGTVLGLLLRAMSASEPDTARIARTLTGDLAGPVVPGPARVRVQVLRRGSNQTNLLATLEQDGQVQATASTVLSAPRNVNTGTQFQPAPEGLKRAWTEVEAVPVGPPFGPEFAQNFEFRSTGPIPFTGATEAVTAGYIRELHPPTALDRPAILGLLDAWWPTLYSVVEEPRPMATVSFTAEFFADPATLPPAEPLFHTGRMVTLQDGFFLEYRELWSGERLVAMNQQTFAVLR